jgi:hypothetical protein
MSIEEMGQYGLDSSIDSGDLRVGRKLAASCSPLV